mmetsp:Transcript_2480/g.4253  ORF Transcript_2480/g.4253 Transcript_2480/m.4253 type:complete len:500 (-) Transcript_2480:45-1544(-)
MGGKGRRGGRGGRQAGPNSSYASGVPLNPAAAPYVAPVNAQFAAVDPSMYAAGYAGMAPMGNAWPQTAFNAQGFEMTMPTSAGMMSGQSVGSAGHSSQARRGAAQAGGDPRRNRRRKKQGKGKQPDNLRAEEDEDRLHFADVCYSLLGYPLDANAEMEFIIDSHQCVPDPHDRALWLGSPKAQTELLNEMNKRVHANARFLAHLVASDEEAQEFLQIPPNHQIQQRNSSKVRAVLRQFVRDWAVEGQQERDSQYGPLLRALEQYLPQTGKEPERYRVLCPGSGLARLTFEVARRGYCAQGNEFSYHMLQGSKWVLNETMRPNMVTIFPFVLGLGHRKGMRDHLRGVQIPDVCPSAVLCPEGVEPRAQDFSMCAGEFVEIYSKQHGEWDSVLTCFFIDTAKNVFLYIRTIAKLIRPGGLWANIGPLLFHYAEQANTISIELSWEEIKPAIERYFIFKEEEEREAYYTTNEIGLFHNRYRCVFFVAIRNETPAEGYSHPVF